MPNNSFLYGKGVFTTVAIARGDPMLWNKHWRRLNINAGKLGIDLSLNNEPSTLAALMRAIGDSGSDTRRARITFFDQRPAGIWPNSSKEQQETGLSIIVAERRSVPKDFTLGISPYTTNSRSPLMGIKSCNYLENILTLDEAKGRGFDEAVRINENGHVTSAAMANIFWLRVRVLYTPSLATGCLPGTTREYLLENLDCFEVEATIDELHGADSIFLTSAGLGVTEVAEFDSRKFGPSDHHIKNILPWTR